MRSAVNPAFGKAKSLIHLKFRLILSCAVLLITGDLNAEGGTCPQGYYPVNSPGVMGCAPIPDYGSQDSGDSPYEPTPRWKTQWVSIAFGVNGLGVAPNMPSKRKAEKAALDKCREMGGMDCHINLTTYNQCVAVAGGGHTAPTAGAADLKTAESLVMEDCVKDPANKECKVYYSACSYPIRVR